MIAKVLAKVLPSEAAEEVHLLARHLREECRALEAVAAGVGDRHGVLKVLNCEDAAVPMAYSIYYVVVLEAVVDVNGAGVVTIQYVSV
jgi:hypothetical protein